MENNIVRIGKVNAIDEKNRKVRVFFEDEGMLSDWLKVLKHSPFIPETTETASGDSSFASHSHNLSTRLWMPDIDETVLCLYIPVFNGDGFVLGAI